MAQQRMNVQAPVARLFAERWSTRAFDPDKAVTPAHLASCLEAARWAPSCYGEAPWRFVCVDRHADAEAWHAVFGTLAKKNQLWAKNAPVFIAAAALPAFAESGAPNRWAEYDTGQATICLCLQATALGLASHQMGGFDVARLRAALDMPTALHLMSVTALGWPGNAEALPDTFQALEIRPRSRKALSEIVHAGRWGRPWHAPQAAGWEARYQETPSERLPWFHPELDPDIATALDTLGLGGGRLLDLGCGPGTQAVALAERGFAVTASDVSATAVAAARKRARRAGADIAFVTDDILHSKLEGHFDVIVDRGVFHCFSDTGDREAYLASVRRLLAPGGYLLLKCFHKSETREEGPPGRYDAADICRFFSDGFELMEAHAGEFTSEAQQTPPKALFCVLRRRDGAT